jgi:hypothetical protein
MAYLGIKGMNHSIQTQDWVRFSMALIGLILFFTGMYLASRKKVSLENPESYV